MSEPEISTTVDAPSHPRSLRVENDFVPRRWLRGGHTQTIMGNFMRHSAAALPAPEERLFTVEKDVQILCHCHWQSDRRQQLTLMIVHGLEGSSSSGYVLGTSANAWARGWNVVRMNVRGCGGTERLSSTLYHSGLSQDVETLVAQMISGDGLRRVALAGFSMGGNQVLRAVGRWGVNAPPELIGVAAVSPACDLAISCDRIHASARGLYEWWFMRSLRSSFRRKAALWPGSYDPTLLRHVHSVHDFDNQITARYMGFQNAEDYYDKASSSHVLDRIAVPTLVIHAEDDPFVVISAASRCKLEQNQHITFLPTRHGGHCAFIAERDGHGDSRWAERKIVEFLAQVESAQSK
jgi:predicted alpha/beta-fold hydrolase